jgi:tripartite-type tricarboxylate transporter receptor subunit TctC
MLRKLIVASALFAAALAASGQSYPSKPIRVIAPFPPGASIDIVARTIGQKMSESMGQPFVVDNRAGASGAIGTELLARAAPDGYTIGIGNPSTHVIPIALKKKMPYDGVKDFTPLSNIAKNILAIVVAPGLPVKSIRELVDYTKNNPGKIFFGTPGNGTTHHLIGEMLNEVAGINMQHVGYRGGGPAITDLLSGQIPVGVASLTTVTPFIKNGRIRVIAIIDDRRYPDLPDVPTGIESFPGFDAKASWVGVFGPAGLPAEIVTRLNAELRKALTDPDVRRRLEANGFEIIGSSPGEFRTLIESDVALWSRIGSSRNIKGD